MQEQFRCNYLSGWLAGIPLHLYDTAGFEEATRADSSASGTSGLNWPETVSLTETLFKITIYVAWTRNRHPSGCVTITLNNSIIDTIFRKAACERAKGIHS